MFSSKSRTLPSLLSRLTTKSKPLTQTRSHQTFALNEVIPESQQIKITFQLPPSKGSEKIHAVAKPGMNLLQLAHKYDIELEGACEGVCACSTCHLILPDTLLDKLDEISEEEEDMLDMAFGLEEGSRLGCQCVLSEKMAGSQGEEWTVKLPSATRNFYVDGHVPKPH